LFDKNSKLDMENLTAMPSKIAAFCTHSCMHAPKGSAGAA
jgi:hypothetical protein